MENVEKEKRKFKFSEEKIIQITFGSGTQTLLTLDAAAFLMLQELSKYKPSPLSTHVINQLDLAVSNLLSTQIHFHIARKILLLNLSFPSSHFSHSTERSAQQQIR